MQKKSIVHILTKSRLESVEFMEELDAIEEISEKYWISNILFYKWDVIKYDKLIKKLEKFHILFKNYSNKEDLKAQILELSNEYEIIFVNTILELLVNVVNEIKALIGHPLSDNPNIFRNKFLQRDLILKHNPELWIKFIKWTPEELNLLEIEKFVKYPFIIKPVDWVQSSWVAKISNKRDYIIYMNTYLDFHDRLKSRWVDSKDLIVEEYIDWNIYSIDYFVTIDSEARISKPVKVRLWIDVKVNDYCNIARIATEKTESEFKWKRLKSFIDTTIKATWIRNTFVHHEFKINSKWEFKTIELNGRIGWWRIELLRRAYGFNVYELLIWSEIIPGKLIENNIAINIYATKRWILKWFNEKIFKQIEDRKSVFWIKYDLNAIWKEIWLTKDWFIKIWVIKLKNKNYSQLVEDFNFIKSKYKNLLDIEVIKVHRNSKFFHVINKFTGIFNKR